MNIKIITIHDIENNFGSTLQACALNEFLIKNGYQDTYLINYKPSYAYHYGKLAQFIKRALFFNDNRIQKKRFKDYFANHSKLTKICTNYDELKNVEKADIYIVGSDQLWNEFYDAGRDDAYYLKFTDCKKKMSYSASLGQLHDEEILNRIVEKTKDFSHIAIREKSSVKQLEDMGQTVTHVLDPVFLFDKEYYIDKDFKNIYGDYLFVYSVNNDVLLDDVVTTIAKKLNLKIVLVGGYLQKCPHDYYIRNAGPVEFVNLIHNAKYVIANSFHATAMAIILNKQFCLVKSNNSPMRLTDMLALSETGDRIIGSATDINHAFDVIDYNKTNIVIDKLRKQSIEYLLSSIKDLED